jgi:hypothetical protein
MVCLGHRLGLLGRIHSTLFSLELYKEWPKSYGRHLRPSLLLVGKAGRNLELECLKGVLLG